jgi:polysaccharide biosynthesis/export protein
MRHARLALLLLFIPAIAGCASSSGGLLGSRWAPPPPAPAAASVDSSPGRGLAALWAPRPSPAPTAASVDGSSGRGLASLWAPRPPAPALLAPALAGVDAIAYGQAIPVATIQAPSPAYTLDSGDRLRVVVFGQDGLTNSYAVDIAGNITLPLIGPVAARGRTTTEVSAALVTRLRDGFLREPHVAVEVEAYRPFFILGEVTFPGQYPYVAHMTVETAVAIAGGFSPRAFRRTVEVSRPVNGVVIRETVPTIMPIRPGDTILVSERWF